MRPLREFEHAAVDFIRSRLLWMLRFFVRFQVHGYSEYLPAFTASMALRFRHSRSHCGFAEGETKALVSIVVAAPAASGPPVVLQRAMFSVLRGRVHDGVPKRRIFAICEGRRAPLDMAE